MKKHLQRILTIWLVVICVPHLLAQQYVDLTDQYILNADFKEGLTGWTAKVDGGNNWTTFGKNPEVVEAYAGWNALLMKNYSLTQEINLPAGDYRLEAYAFYRQGQSFDTDKDKSLAYLIAGDNKIKVKTLGSENVGTYANDVTQASAAFGTGLYLNTLQFEITDNTSLRIGIEGTHDAGYSWVITGPFKLYKAMTSEDQYNLIKEELEKLKGELNPAWQQKIEKEVDQPVTDYNAGVERLEKLQAEVNAFLPSYKDILSLYAENSELYNNTSETDDSHRQLFGQQITTIEGKLETALTTTELATIQTDLLEARSGFITYAVPNSGQLLNFSFYTKDISYQINGWTKSYNCQNHVHKASTEKNNGELVVTSQEGFIENWNPSNLASGELSYTLTNLPMGVYTITAYTFDNVKSGKVDFFANGISIDLDASTDKFTLSQLESVEVGADRSLKFGLRIEAGATNWIGISHIELYKSGNLPFSSDLWTEMLEAGKDIDKNLLPPTVAEWLTISLTKEPTGDATADAAALNELTNVVTLAQNIIMPYSDLLNKIAELKEIGNNSVASSTEIANKLNSAITNAEKQLMTINTVEDVNELTKALEDVRKNYITNAQPNTGYQFDMTYLLVNPNFDQSNINGWKVDDYTGEKNYPKFGAGSVEFWHCTFNLNQNIVGLPNGEYKLSAQIAATRYEGVRIFAGEVSNTMSNISLGIDGSNLQTTGNAFASDREKYRTYINFNVTDGTIKIGIKNLIQDNWVVLDDFQLAYLGENTSSYFKDLTDKILQIEERYKLMEKVPNGIAQRTEQAIASAKNLEAASSIEDLTVAINELDAINKQLDIVDANYSKFLEISNICKELLSKTNQNQARDDFNSIYEDAENKIKATTDANNISTQTMRLTEARTAFIKTGPSVMEGESLDVTFMIQNPACTAKEGWATTGTEGNFQCKPDIAVIGEYNGTFLEKWDASVSFTKGQMPIYQNINDLPEGIYELRTAAFRKNLNGNGQTPEYSVALTLNDAFTVINSNVMNYYTVKGYVGSDGIATIGLKAMFDNQANWNGIADVSLWYLGNETTAYEAMKDELADELVSRSDTMTITRKLREYMLNSAQASESATNIESIIDICNEMRTLLTNATEAVIAYQVASEARNKSVFLLDNSKNGDRTTFENEIDRYENEMELADNRTSLYDLSTKFRTINQNYMISEGARPINGTAFDLSFLITNRNFESGTNGWNTDASIENGENFRVWQDASVNGEYNGKFCERYYNGQNRLDEANGGRAIYQVLTGLPKGMYNIKAAAFGQRVWIGEAYSNNNISLYLNERQEEIKQNVLNYTYIQNVLHQGGDMEFGILLNEQNKYNWIGLGDVQLYYLGNIDLKLYEYTEFSNDHDNLADVTLMTSNDAERWRTLCLPFDVDAATLNDQMEVREITGFETNGKDCIFTLGRPISGISAGKTYAVKMKNNTGSVVLNDVFIPAGLTPESAVLENNGVKAVIKGYFAPEELENECYTLYEEQDAFTVPSDHMAKAFQASLKLEGTMDAYERILLSVDGIITSIDNAYHAGSEIDVYNVNGIMIKKGVQYENALKDLPKGIYIINGKKVMK